MKNEAALTEIFTLFLSLNIHIQFYTVKNDITVTTVVLDCCKGDKPSQWETTIFGPL